MMRYRYSTGFLAPGFSISLGTDGAVPVGQEKDEPEDVTSD